MAVKGGAAAKGRPAAYVERAPCRRGGARRGRRQRALAWFYRCGERWSNRRGRVTTPWPWRSPDASVNTAQHDAHDAHDAERAFDAVSLDWSLEHAEWLLARRNASDA